MALFETEMINQYHNRHLLAFITVLNSMNPENPVDCRDFILNVKQLSGEESEYSEELISDLIERAFENNILSNEKSKIRKTTEKNILLPMTLQEKIYLKNILKSHYAFLFFDKPVIYRLLEELSDVPDIDFSKIIDFKGISKEPDFDEVYIQNFRLLVQAILQKRKISFINTDSEGRKRSNIERIPFRIEYSLIMRCFWISLWNQEEKRPFKASVSRISDIKLLNVISVEEHQKVMHMLEEKREQHPIVMIVKNKRNSIERINLLLSMYHKEIERIDDNTIKISLSYYNFDENEIIDGIMSFGSAVQVLSPDSVVKKIKEKLLVNYKKIPCLK